MTTSRWELITTLALCAVLGSGALWGLGAVAVHDWLVSWERAGRSTTLLHLGLLTATAGAWLAAMTYIGPQARSAPSLQWIPAAPRPGAVLRFGSACAGGAAVVAVVLLIAPTGTLTGNIGMAIGFTVILVMLGMLTHVGQRSDARVLLMGSAAALGLVALALLAASIGHAAVTAVVSAVAVVVFARAVVRTRFTSPAVLPPRWSLVRASENRWSAYASLVMLDGSVARQVRERWAGRPHGWPPSFWPGLGATTTRVGTVWMRQLPAVTPIALVMVYLAASVVNAWSLSGALVLVALVLGWIGVTTSVQADRWADAPALRRTFTAVATPVLLAPTLLSMWLVTAIAVAVLGATLAQAVVLVVLAPALVVRRHRSRQTGATLWAISPMGAVPLDHLNRLIAGWDVALVAAVIVSAL